MGISAEQESALLAEAAEHFRMGEPIDAFHAHVIAAQWHGGQSSPLYSLVSTGTVTGYAEWEVGNCLVSAESRDDLTDDDRDALRALLDYVRANAPDTYAVIAGEDYTEFAEYAAAVAYANELADELETLGYVTDRSWASRDNMYAIEATHQTRIRRTIEVVRDV